MNALKAAILLAVLLAIVGVASAQDDPTVNESDFDTTTPEADESYLESEGSSASSEEPTLRESDFDTSVPGADESYLADGDGSPDGSARGTPALGLVAALGALAAIALARRRA